MIVLNLFIISKNIGSLQPLQKACENSISRMTRVIGVATKRTESNALQSIVIEKVQKRLLLPGSFQRLEEGEKPLVLEKTLAKRKNNNTEFFNYEIQQTRFFF